MSALTTDRAEVPLRNKGGFAAIIKKRDRGIWERRYHDVSLYSVPKISAFKFFPGLQLVMSFRYQVCKLYAVQKRQSQALPTLA